MRSLFRLLKADFDQYANYLSRGGEKVGIYRLYMCSFLGIGSSQTVLLYRISRWSLMNRIPLLHSLISRINILLNGAEISAYADIGPGFFVAHSQGIVIGKNVKCGRNLTVFQQITLGAKAPFDGKEEMPCLGNDVTLYAGCKVLGPIHIGDRVKIGANVVVTSDVLDQSTVVINRLSYLTLRKVDLRAIK